MVNLESDTPYFYWTFDKFEDLEQRRSENGFEDSVWKSDVIPSYDILGNSIELRPARRMGLRIAAHPLSPDFRWTIRTPFRTR